MKSLLDLFTVLSWGSVGQLLSKYGAITKV